MASDLLSGSHQASTDKRVDVFWNELPRSLELFQTAVLASPSHTRFWLPNNASGTGNHNNAAAAAYLVAKRRKYCSSDPYIATHTRSFSFYLRLNSSTQHTFSIYATQPAVIADAVAAILALPSGGSSPNHHPLQVGFGKYHQLGHDPFRYHHFCQILSPSSVRFEDRADESSSLVRRQIGFHWYTINAEHSRAMAHRAFARDQASIIHLEDCAFADGGRAFCDAFEQEQQALIASLSSSEHSLQKQTTQSSPLLSIWIDHVPFSLRYWSRFLQLLQSPETSWLQEVKLDVVRLEPQECRHLSAIRVRKLVLRCCVLADHGQALRRALSSEREKQSWHISSLHLQTILGPENAPLHGPDWTALCAALSVATRQGRLDEVGLGCWMSLDDDDDDQENLLGPLYGTVVLHDVDAMTCGTLSRLLQRVAGTARKLVLGTSATPWSLLDAQAKFEILQRELLQVDPRVACEYRPDNDNYDMETNVIQHCWDEIVESQLQWNRYQCGVDSDGFRTDELRSKLLGRVVVDSIHDKTRGCAPSTTLRHVHYILLRHVDALVLTMEGE